MPAQRYASRRDFLRHSLGFAYWPASTLLPADILASLQNPKSMKVTRIEVITFRKDLRIGGGSGGSGTTEWLWVRLHTDQGITGLGETYPFTQSELGALRDYANQILGRDPRDLDLLWRNFYHQMAMRNAGGADMRALSALSMAQWDILGKVAGLPLYRLLGGRTRSQVRVYNTTTNYWAINEMRMGPDTARIVEFLLERGITAMKIYPFDARDRYLSSDGLERGMQWIREIRKVAGSAMDICVDCWGHFDLPSALRIAKALEPYDIMYLEDPMPPGHVEAYARLAAETSVPVCMSETLATRYEFREYMDKRAADVVMFDICWCGGPGEAKKIADMADTYMLPVSPHTCGGPLLYFCSVHLCTAIPNFLIMESNYWKYTHQYAHFISNVPVPQKGSVVAPELPGIGAQIREEIFRNGDAMVETIASV